MFRPFCRMDYCLPFVCVCHTYLYSSSSSSNGTIQLTICDFILSIPIIWISVRTFLCICHLMLKMKLPTLMLGLSCDVLLVSIIRYSFFFRFPFGFDICWRKYVANWNGMKNKFVGMGARWPHRYFSVHVLRACTHQTHRNKELANQMTGKKIHYKLARKIQNQTLCYSWVIRKQQKTQRKKSCTQKERLWRWRKKMKHKKKNKIERNEQKQTNLTQTRARTHTHRNIHENIAEAAVEMKYKSKQWQSTKAKENRSKMKKRERERKKW